MSTEIADRIEQAGNVLNGTIDSTGYGLISCFDHVCESKLFSRVDRNR